VRNVCSYAYLEFADEESVANAVLLNETLFRGRLLKVTSKRTNIPGYSRGGYGAPRGFRARRTFAGRRARRPHFYHPYS
jgi:polyadenylate-binding protein 2